MSFIITLYTREGIVMASDSRLTLNTQQQTPDGQIVMLAAGMSDSNYKTFLVSEKIGISTFGQADINGNPISGFIQSFISQHSDVDISISEFASELNNHFKLFNPIPDVGFHISGYELENEIQKPKIFRVTPSNNQVILVNPDDENGETQGAIWDGENDVLSRLILPVYSQDDNGIFQPLPQFQIPWQFFTIQDAIDFAVFAIQTTIDCVKFFPRAKTVGGPIDVLVITRERGVWINRKELHVNTPQTVS